MNRHVHRAWAAHGDKVRYVLVGGWNTLVQYAVFAACWYLLHDRFHPDVVLLISYLIGSVNGFLCFRYIVFKPVSHPLGEYLRFQVVYVPLLVLNMVVLPLLLKHTTLNVYVIQALFAMFVVVAGYLGNKYFTFRRSDQSQDSVQS